jgi:ketosteroid isomerase-like protein
MAASKAQIKDWREGEMQVGKLALASAILLGSSIIASADPTTPQEIGQAMCQRYTTAFNAKDLDAQMALYTDDATQMSPEQGMIVGSAARKKNFTDAYKVTSNHHCNCTNAAQIGKDATWAAGTWDLTVSTEKGPQKVGGYYSVVLVGASPNTKVVLETWNNKP